MALDWQNCPRCAGRLLSDKDAPAPMLKDLKMPVQSCRRCKRYRIKGDDRWIQDEGDITVTVSAVRERAMAIIQERDDHERRMRDMLESDISDPRWQQW